MKLLRKIWAVIMVLAGCILSLGTLSSLIYNFVNHRGSLQGSANQYTIGFLAGSLVALLIISYISISLIRTGIKILFPKEEKPNTLDDDLLKSL